MYDLRPFDAPQPTVRRTDPDIELFAAAVRRYQSLCMRSQLACLWARLRGKQARLLDLSETKAHARLVGSHDAGVHAVALRQIRGSEGRTSDFDCEFRPRGDSSRQRWAGIYAARLSGVPMPAVRLVRVGAVYFVRDGHHRVSVARQMREEFIDAEVTVWELAPEPAGEPLVEPAHLSGQGLTALAA